MQPEPEMSDEELDAKFGLTSFQRKVKNLKRQARRLVKTTGIPQHAALNKLAMQEGFQTWALFMKNKGEKGKDNV